MTWPRVAWAAFLGGLWMLARTHGGQGFLVFIALSGEAVWHAAEVEEARLSETMARISEKLRGV